MRNSLGLTNKPLHASCYYLETATKEWLLSVSFAQSGRLNSASGRTLVFFACVAVVFYWAEMQSRVCQEDQGGRLIDFLVFASF